MSRALAMSPLVSIIVPCYNAAPYVAQTLESALAQTWTRCEIIVVDDGSTDESLEIIRSFENKNVKVIAQPNRGGCAARNRGIAEAQGDFIQFLDADDLLTPNKIKVQLGALQKTGENWLASAGWWCIGGSNPPEGRSVRDMLWADATPVEWLVRAWDNCRMMPPHCFLSPRGVIERAGPWDETLVKNQDGEYFCRVMLGSVGIKFCEETRVYYRTGNLSSITHTESRAAWESILYSHETTTVRLLAHENSARTRRAAATCFQNFIFHIYPHAPDLVRQAEQHVRELGGCDLKPKGTLLFRLLSHVMGWKAARRLHRALRPRNYPPLRQNGPLNMPPRKAKTPADPLATAPE